MQRCSDGPPQHTEATGPVSTEQPEWWGVCLEVQEFREPGLGNGARVEGFVLALWPQSLAAPRPAQWRSEVWTGAIQET